MESIGEYLQRLREERGLSIEQVADETRISPVYLRALEENRLEEFPGEVFARGFARVYGRCLGLDDQDTMTRFSKAAQSFFEQQAENKRSTRQLAEQARSRREHRGRTIEVVAVIAMGLAVLLVYGIQSKRSAGTGDVISTSAPSPLASLPEAPIPVKPPSEQMLPAVNKPSLKGPGPKLSPVPMATQAEAVPAMPESAVPPADPVPPTAPADEKLPVAVNVPGQMPGPSVPVEKLVLRIEAMEPSWVSAKMDDGDPKEVLLKTGEEVTYQASEQFLVSFGNAGGVKVQLNGKSLPPFGGRGAVVKNILLKRE